MSVFTLEFEGFWRDAHSSSIPEINGVYVVYRCNHNILEDTVTLNQILYIGESGNVGKRIIGHERRGDWKRKLRVGEELCFSVARIAGRDRCHIEAALIYKHQPLLNDEYKNTFPYTQTRVISAGRASLLVKDFTVNNAQSAYSSW